MVRYRYLTVKSCNSIWADALVGTYLVLARSTIFARVTSFAFINIILTVFPFKSEDALAVIATDSIGTVTGVLARIVNALINILIAGVSMVTRRTLAFKSTNQVSASSAIPAGVIFLAFVYVLIAIYPFKSTYTRTLKSSDRVDAGTAILANTV